MNRRDLDQILIIFSVQGDDLSKAAYAAIWQDEERSTGRDALLREVGRSARILEQAIMDFRKMMGEMK